MSDFKSKMHQNRFRLSQTAYSIPQTPVVPKTLPQIYLPRNVKIPPGQSLAMSQKTPQTFPAPQTIPPSCQLSIIADGCFLVSAVFMVFSNEPMSQKFFSKHLHLLHKYLLKYSLTDLYSQTFSSETEHCIVSVSHTFTSYFAINPYDPQSVPNVSWVMWNRNVMMKCHFVPNTVMYLTGVCILVRLLANSFHPKFTFEQYCEKLAESYTALATA